MKLLYVKIEPKDRDGWSSKKLIFGDQITQVFGANGSGKTPIIQMVMFALGYPMKFRDDIYRHCDSVLLVFEVNGEIYSSKRKIQNTFELEIYSLLEKHIFYGEKEFSKFLFDLLGFDFPNLISTSKESVVPYISTILPLYYLDQDNGYTNIYKPSSSFIQDQYSEMIKLIFKLPPKHSFDKKRQIISLNERLSFTDQKIVNQKKFIEKMESEWGDIEKNTIDIDNQLDLFTKQMEDLKSTKTIKSDSILISESWMLETRKDIKKITDDMTNLVLRVQSFEKIKQEIEIEINTLGLNEEAKRLFSSFDEICSNTNCGLFMGSSDTYGKNLLYLKDQIKDLERNTEIFEDQIENLKNRQKQHLKYLNTLIEHHNQLQEQDESNSLVETISELVNKIFHLQKDKEILKNYDIEKSNLRKDEKERAKIQDELASYSNDSNDKNIKEIELRNTLKNKIIYWLDILNTKNVSREISIDNNFIPTFNSEKINQFKGSTLLRVILAIHAAIFEIYLQDGTNNLRFLIMDTPRQHEIQSEDFEKFIKELKKLVENNHAQIIFSSTEYRYECKAGDMEWLPEFEGIEQKMFLGQEAIFPIVL